MYCKNIARFIITEVRAIRECVRQPPIYLSIQILRGRITHQQMSCDPLKTHVESCRIWLSTRKN